ncbi:MAG TPA: EAL domain-containing protein [Sulfuricaulis sp.]|nr:EAL domain-containing protein [Sulfuricaulis sp.]
MKNLDETHRSGDSQSHEEIAQTLGKQTIAEFVENKENFRPLTEYGVDDGQGYHLGRPDITLPCQAIVDHAGNTIACRNQIAVLEFPES